MAADVTPIEGLPDFATVAYLSQRVVTLREPGLQALGKPDPRARVVVPRTDPEGVAAEIFASPALELARSPAGLIQAWLEMDATRRFNSEIEHLAQLPEDFDGEGSPSYLPLTMSAASDFVQRLAESYRTEFGESFPLPSVLPGPNGSVDLRWRNRHAKLLVNVSPSKGRSPSSYGEDAGTQESLSLRLSDEDSRARLLRWIHDRWARPQ